ncbi:hypothetical protein V3C99_008654 [Haemonchus contortus]|uniref:Transposase n=1 Tax=Haemonchus contortus TaxID=6289 RepID=A0A7I4YK60_HAECO
MRATILQQRASCARSSKVGHRTGSRDDIAVPPSVSGANDLHLFVLSSFWLTVVEQAQVVCPTDNCDVACRLIRRMLRLRRDLVSTDARIEAHPPATRSDDNMRHETKWSRYVGREIARL